MSWTVFYKGTLDVAKTPADVFAIVVEAAKKYQWTYEFDDSDGSLSVDFPDSMAETLTFAFVEGKIDGWCKFLFSEQWEYQAILNLFYTLTPLFSEYEIFDDYDLWPEFLEELDAEDTLT